MHLTIAIIEDEQPAHERIGELVIQELSGETEVYIEKYEDAERFLKALEQTIIQPNIEKEQQTPKIQYFRGFLYILKIYQTPSKHTKMFR